MSGELTKRIVFGVVAAPIAIAIVLYGGAPLAALLAVTAALGAWEFYRIVRATGIAPLDEIGIPLAGLIPLLAHARFLGLYDPNGRHSPGIATLVILASIAILAISIWTRGVAGRPLAAVASTVFGVIYTGGAISFAYAIAAHEYAFAPSEWKLFGWQIPSGGLLLLLPLFITW